MTTRVYQAIELTPQQEITLDSAASNHLCQVLRLKEGAEVILFNGQGGEYQGTITLAHKRHTQVKLTTLTQPKRESPLHIHLGQGIARGDRMDYALQKATELGVTTITPLIMQHTSIKLTQTIITKKMTHWRRIIISACEQCGRYCLPQLNHPLPLSEWLPSLQQIPGVVLDPQATQQLQSLSKLQHSIALLVGPEGGLNSQELEQCQPFNFTRLNLGPRILRTETATSSAIAILQALYGDM